MRATGSHLMACVLLCGGPTAASSQVLLSDQFAGSSLDATKWRVGTWQLGRTRLGNLPTVSNGVASLRFDTYDPAAPGQTFRGTEIYSAQSFSRGYGLELTAAVRTNAMPDGLVTSFFTYTFVNGLSDEIDFEALTNQINHPDPAGQRLQLTTWHNWDQNHPNPNNKSSLSVPLPGLDLHQFNTYTIRWLPDETQWLVNGTLVRSTTAALAQEPMPVRLNFWAPSNSWAEAYSASLVPASTPQANQSFHYDVSSVTVRALPQPIPGDADRDGSVDFTDLVSLARHYGKSSGATWSQGDFNADGSVGFDDLVTLARHYGQSLPATDASGSYRAIEAIPTPEPATLALLGLGGMALLRRPRCS